MFSGLPFWQQDQWKTGGNRRISKVGIIVTLASFWLQKQEI